jgi:hypothetical protein
LRCDRKSVQYKLPGLAMLTPLVAGLLYIIRSLS